ncbi:Transcriptional regulator, GntR family [Sulfitobacter noctilucicola]|uniref:DNA-binding transcriptional MocR family regulator n=1 Tax=Sulfitobacter noctilucicola TaxID=1342301 RepID=A0A7W6M919_9RHOB|nr:PLP-dependent aminotransferase family protein [Sulfitobacter noctilucicola]KIN65175.1 Transcriptional regulator, GntR family [Sulfitobacter noctilucicola]MBB4173691.1 DNA-binding transcriptional MocR family regulator [Sulfitobacter noctilucicola]
MDTIWVQDGLRETKPKYKAVVALIRDQIASGTLSVGEKLPPVRDLAWKLQITPGTVARAYTVLTDSGVLHAEVGRGTFVSDPSTGVDKEAGERPLNLIEIDAVRHNTGGDTDVVNLFSPHLPDGGQAALIRGLLAEIAQDPPSGIMHYPSRRSAMPARMGMAQWLQGAPIGQVDQSDIVLSHGGQNAILLVLQTILRGRRPVVFVEELAYPGFRRAAELLRADVVPIACDNDGIIPEALAEQAERHPEAQVLCTSPEVHSPTCGFTPMARRLALVEVARRADLQILEDDCYRMGRAEGEGYRQLAPERGWYVSSLSKSVTPALRIGCAIGPKGMSGALHRSAEHGFFGLATPMLDLAAALLSHPQLPQIMKASRLGVERYVKSAVNTLGGFDLMWRSDVPFLWLKLPQGWRASAFCQAAEQAGVQIRAAEEFAARDAQSPHAVRMAVNGGVSLRSFEAAMERLRVLLDNPPDEIGV